MGWSWASSHLLGPFRIGWGELLVVTAPHQDPSQIARHIAIPFAPAVEPLGPRRDCRFAVPRPLVGSTPEAAPGDLE